MRFLYTFLIVLFFTTISIGQSFNLQELIKMSKMNVDDFDTYVSSKGFVFLYENNDNPMAKGLTYGLNPSRNNILKAEKFLTVYSEFFDYKFNIVYQNSTNNHKAEYARFKNQIKTLGFKFIESGVTTSERNGKTFNSFIYKKGNSEISLYATDNGFELSYNVKLE